MPVISAANLVRLRTTRHASILGLAVYQPATIWTAQVNGAQTQGDTTVMVDGVVQTRAPARHFLVLFGSSAGARDYGTARWESYSAPTLTVGAHNATLPNDAYVTVLEEIPLESVHVSLSATDVVSEDGTIAYTDQNTKYHPLARCGPPAVAYIDPSTGLATVKFYSSSVAMAGALSTYAWSFRGGTPNTSAIAGTSAVPITVTWNTPGQYYISLTVTDSNGKTHTTYRPVFIFNQYSGTLPYTSVEIESCQGEVEQGGWTCSLSVYGAATPATFPSGAMVVLFSDDYFGTEHISIGGQYTYRENIVLVGYVRRGTTHQNWAKGSVDFDVEGIGVALSGLTGLAATLISDGTPAGWHELAGMTSNLAAFHILSEHSTVTQIADVHLDLLTYTRGTIDLMGTSLREQLLSGISTAVRGRVGSSSQGMLYLESNPQLLELASRTNPVVLSTTFPDLRDQVDFGEERPMKDVSQIDFGGEDASGNPVFSLAPATPWPSGLPDTVDSIRVTDQADSNTIAGLFEAYRNNEFGDVSLPWRGDYRVFDVYPAEAVQVSIGASQNKRGISWTNQRCWTKRVYYEYPAAGVLLVSSDVEKDSYGNNGITGEYPSETDLPDVPLPDIPTVTIDTPPSPVPYGPVLTPGKGNLLYQATNKGIAKCVNAYAGTPVWSAVNTGLAGDALNVYGINFDPFSASGGCFTRMWAMTKDGLYLGTGCPNPTFTQKLSAAAAAGVVGVAAAGCLLGPAFTPSVRLPNFIATFLKDVTNDTWYLLWSLDNGTTWQANTTNYWRISFNSTPLIQPSAHADDTLYISCRTGYDNFLTGARWNSDSPNPTCDLYKFTISTGVLQRAQLCSLSAAGVGASFVSFPYCNSAGAVYANDSVGYFNAITGSALGIQDVEKCTSMFSPFYSHGYVPPACNGYGDSVLMAGGSVNGVLLIHMWDENYQSMLMAGTTNLFCLTTVGGGDGNWIAHTVAELGTNTVRSLYMVPADKQILLFAAEHNAGLNHALTMISTNYGSTWTDFSKPGLADGLDAVLSLGGGDTLTTLLLDYLQV